MFTHSIAEAKKLAIFSPFEEYLASKYWPGPLTLILKKKGKKFYNGDKRLSKVGIRIPKNKDVMKILEYIQKPLATTSANIHGEINIKSLNQLGIIKSKDVTYAIEKKGKMSFKESTLVETKNNQINIIREGSLSKKLINKELNRINDFLQGIFRGVGIKLVDFKVEFGRYEKNGKKEIILADEISPDTCRLWDVNSDKKLDKDRFRKGLGNLIEAYQEVARRLDILHEQSNIRPLKYSKPQAVKIKKK